MEDDFHPNKVTDIEVNCAEAVTPCMTYLKEMGIGTP